MNALRAFGKSVRMLELFSDELSPSEFNKTMRSCPSIEEMFLALPDYESLIECPFHLSNLKRLAFYSHYGTTEQDLEVLANATSGLRSIDLQMDYTDPEVRDGFVELLR